MIEGRSTERDLWLQLVCLVASIGVHVGLVVVGWQGFSVFQGKDRAIVVTLKERPAATPLQNGPAVAAACQEVRASVPLRRSPAISSRSAAPAVTDRTEVSVRIVEELKPAEAPPLATSVVTGADNAPLSDEESGASSPASGGGGGTQNGAALQGDGSGAGDGAGAGDQEGLTVLIRATPRYKFNPKPDYPAIARQNRWEGTVCVLARVTAGGVVERVSLERGSGHAMLDRSALDSVRSWRFVPASRGGVPIPCDVSIPVAFKLTE
jgi:protein TonB